MMSLHLSLPGGQRVYRHSMLKRRKLLTAATLVTSLVLLCPPYLIFCAGKLALLAFPLHDKGMILFQFCESNYIKPFQLVQARARTGCDLMNLFFIIDEHSDVEGEHVVREMAEVVMDALRNPHKPRPENEWVGGEASRFVVVIFQISFLLSDSPLHPLVPLSQSVLSFIFILPCTYVAVRFWQLAIRTATQTAQKRFVDTFGEYMNAVVQQAEDRSQKNIRTLDSYLEVRRDTIGAKPSFAILELEMDLPDDVFNHPILEKLRVLVIDMLCIGNVRVKFCAPNFEIL